VVDEPGGAERNRIGEYSDHTWKQSNVLSIDGDKNNVMVMEEFGSIEKAKAFAASSELKTAMAKAGVASAPEMLGPLYPGAHNSPPSSVPVVCKGRAEIGRTLGEHFTCTRCKVARTRDIQEEERDDFARQLGVHVDQKRRSPPRLPAGTLRLRGIGEGGCIPVSAGVSLTEVEIGLYRLLRNEVLKPLEYGIAAGVPVTEEHRRCLSAMGLAAFGFAPEDALWLVPYLIELEAARSERLVLESNAADPGVVDLTPLARRVLKRTRHDGSNCARRRVPSVAHSEPDLTSAEAVLLYARWPPARRSLEAEDHADAC
jgi:hypothetical protein